MNIDLRTHGLTQRTLQSRSMQRDTMYAALIGSCEIPPNYAKQNPDSGVPTHTNVAMLAKIKCSTMSIYIDLSVRQLRRIA